jgi:hypothetical protein
MLLDDIIKWPDEEKSNLFRLLRDADERVCRKEHDTKNNLRKLEESYMKSCSKKYPENFGMAKTEMVVGDKDFQFSVADPFEDHSKKPENERPNEIKNNIRKLEESCSGLSKTEIVSGVRDFQVLVEDP